MFGGPVAGALNNTTLLTVIVRKLIFVNIYINFCKPVLTGAEKYTRLQLFRSSGVLIPITVFSSSISTFLPTLMFTSPSTQNQLHIFKIVSKTMEGKQQSGSQLVNVQHCFRTAVSTLGLTVSLWNIQKQTFFFSFSVFYSQNIKLKKPNICLKKQPQRHLWLEVPEEEWVGDDHLAVGGQARALVHQVAFLLTVTQAGS